MDQLALALSACAPVLRPVVKLALALGLKQQHLQEILSDLLLDEARTSWRAKGVEPNLSQLSVTTGMNRKAVTGRVRAPKDALAPTERSSAAKTLTLWLEMATDNPALRTLPVVAEGKAASFETLAWGVSRGDLHHRAILDELVRLGLVIEREGCAELKAEGFIPANDLPGMLSFFADNGRDHLNAAVSNLLAEKDPLLERSIFAQGLTLEACEQIHRLVRERWGSLHHELAHEMRSAIATNASTATGRIRVGIYTYVEDTQDIRGESVSASRTPQLKQ